MAEASGRAPIGCPPPVAVATEERARLGRPEAAPRRVRGPQLDGGGTRGAAGMDAKGPSAVAEPRGRVSAVLPRGLRGLGRCGCDRSLSAGCWWW